MGAPMAINVYLDESGTHGHQSPVTIMASFIASAQRWDSYEADMQALLNEYAVKTFHAKKFRQSKGDFKGWTSNKKAPFNSRFLRMSDDYLEDGFCVVLNNDLYRSVYRSRGAPRKSRLDTEYGLCFRICLWNAMRFAKERPSEWPVTMVLEDGHRNSSDALRVRREELAWLRDEYKAMVRPVAFDSKETCLPLAAADSLAYNMFRYQSGLTSHPLENVVPAGPADPQYIVSKMPLRRYVVTEEMLHDMRHEAADQSWRFRLAAFD